MRLPTKLPSRFDSNDPLLARLIGAGVLGGIAEYNPLALNPYLALDPELSGSTALMTGGADAGYYDLIATHANPGSGSDAVQTTSASQPRYLWDDSFTGAFLHCPGIGGNGASVPHATNLDVGASDFRVECEFIAKASGAFYTFAGKYVTGTRNGWIFRRESTGTLSLFTSGSTLTSSSVALSLTGSRQWVAVSRRASDGRVQFETSSDGVTWTQLGTDQSVTVGTPSTVPLEIGVYNGFNSAPLQGGVKNLRLCQGGTTVLDIAFSDATHGDTSFVCSTGQTVSVQRTGNNPAAIKAYPEMRGDAVDDELTGTTSTDISSDRVISVYTDNTTYIRGVRNELVSASAIISNVGTDYTILENAADLGALYVISAARSASDQQDLVDYLASTYGAADLT